MKKYTSKKRHRDVLRSLEHRNHSYCIQVKYIPRATGTDFKEVNRYIKSEIENGLICTPISNNRKRKILIVLPEVMNFDSQYETTVRHINAIIKLVGLTQKYKGKLLPKTAYELMGVNFDNLKEISTPAALVLTSEISNWEDSTRRKLKPQVKCWDDNIYQQLHDLGFFDLFDNKPNKKICSTNKTVDKKLVRYKKGVCGEKGITRILKHEISTIVGDDITKWTFLHSGLDEAITNVSHHAYPQNQDRRSMKKIGF